MEHLPEPVWEFLQEWIARRFVFGFILVDSEGLVRSWGGALSSLGLPPLVTGQPVSEQLLFAEGLFPPQVPTLYLPMVKIAPDTSMDVHLFQTPSGYGLFLVDATAHEQAIARWQQHANNLARKAEATAQFADSTNELYAALDIAAMRLNPEGTFDVLGQAPGWLVHYCPDMCEGHISFITPENSFSFLENFLVEAHVFWNREEIGCVKSGLWIETEDDDREHYFEAIAVTTSHDKILLITRDLSYFDEKRRLIQTGREIASEKDALQSLQRELLASHKTLEERVHERTRQLQEANTRLTGELNWRHQLEQERAELMRQLQQTHKMEAIGTLAGGIAHDFNNILSAILGFTELSLKEAGDNQVLCSNLKHVLRATDRARDLIRRILTFSRQSAPENKPIQPKAVIQEALKLLRATLPASVEMQDELESDAFILADPTQLHQVVINLCTNAAQAMQEKGGLLSVRLTDLNLQPDDMTAYPELHPGPHIELAIRDTGHGMSEDVLRKVFDPFFTTKEEGQGTGMGLSVVHGIVKSCHGAIFAASQPGAGSIFRVLLPIIQVSDLDEPLAVTQIRGGNECILFIDDEPMQVELAIQMLGRLGYNVVAINDSLQALARFAEKADQFDLVISDMNMPKMNGWAITRRLRQIRPDVPIILCSGYHDNLYHLKPVDLQVQGYLTKPIPMTEMARAIRRVLDR